MVDTPVKTSLPETIKRAFKEFREDDMMTWAASLTYYAVLSLFPALIVMVALLGVFGEYPKTSDAVLDIVADIGPASAVETLRGTIEGVVENSGGAGALLGVGLVAAIWSASGYVGGFFKAANAIYDVEEGRSWKRLIPLRLALTVIFLLASVLGALAFVTTGELADAIFSVVGLGDTALDVWNYAKFPVLMVLVMGMIALLYYAAPNVQHPRFRILSVGGAVGLVAVILASVAFGFYVANFGSYNKTYGTLAFVPLFLTWLWIANLALLFGAEVDAEIARNQQIRAGMRPVDTEPFLPLREEPDAEESAPAERVARPRPT